MSPRHQATTKEYHSKTLREYLEHAHANIFACLDFYLSENYVVMALFAQKCETIGVMLVPRRYC